VVAEGVEQSGQAEILTDLGCAKLQGYLFSKPMDRDVCGAYLLANSFLPQLVENPSGTS
jgi:EAL domain-containing protein (putative c-di-GMP-specific phosphodiesterase class I)